MQTIITDSPEAAAIYIKRGGIVAFPTETVYGLGANIFDGLAVAKIFEAKQRPADNPLIAHISDIGQVTELSDDINEYARKFIDAFFPGPLTIVLRKSQSVPLIATAALDTIGIRMPRFSLAQRFLAECGTPVVAPSANLSGRPSPTTWQSVVEDLDGRIDCVLRSEAAEIGIESTVVDCTSAFPMLLRAGSISIEELRSVVPQTVIFDGADLTSPKSPGMRHRHYSPRAQVKIIADQDAIVDPPMSAYIGLSQLDHMFAMERICASSDEYAHTVFEFFRECDRSGISMIYCEKVEETGIGIAVMDRLRRAAES